MNNIVINYLLKSYFKNFFIITTAFYLFGIILNLFEEVEFFKNSDVTIFTPLLLTCVFVPSLIIKLLPFIIFISSIWFMVQIRNNKELLTLKVYGYSNLKIFFILAFASFFLGWIILFLINPLSSSLVKYYEKTKSSYARDIDHLVSFNKNGLWIKETFDENERIITASNPDQHFMYDVHIFELDKNFSLKRKIFSKKADIKDNIWVLSDVKIYTLKDGIMEKEIIDNLLLNSIYNYEKINNLFNNSDTFSFLEISINFNKMLEKGYNKEFLQQSLHTMMTLPFYLFVMTAIATILTLHTMKNSENFRFFIIGLILIVIIYYLKDLSLALGKTDRIPLILSIWTPIIALSFFTIIGVIQINEK
tara:strand:- start:4496 stop:5584 length:1089 start_codon:yes stop_codon:yes gene_type:complete